MTHNIHKIIQEIPRNKHNQRTVIGIDGLSRSGKTTIVNQMKQILQDEEIPVYIFHIDDYIVERKRRYNTSHEQWYEYYFLQWDLEWVTNHLFNNLKCSNELHLLFYDDKSDSLQNQIVRLPDSCLIIIEGVFLQRDEWRNFFDYMIFIDCPREKRFIRESLGTQSNVEKFKNRYWKAEDYYLNTVFPMEKADLVIQN